MTDAFEGRVVDAPIAERRCLLILMEIMSKTLMSRLVDDFGFFNVDTFTVPEGSSAKVISKGVRTQHRQGTTRSCPDIDAC